MKKKQAMYEKIESHGKVLNNIFETGLDPIALCKKLRRLEVKGNRLALGYCNGDTDSGYFEREEVNIMKQLDKILKYESKGVPVFFNSDPRGYALKIRTGWTTIYNNKAENRIERDWGGYGILAPDFNEV